MTGTGPNNTGTVKLTATSDDDGRIFFNNLEAGTYTLKETKAPAGSIKDTTEHSVVGYIKDTTEHSVVISAAYKEDTTLHGYTITIDQVNTATYTATTNASNETICEVPADGNYSFPINNKKGTLTISAKGGTYDGTTAYGATITDTYGIQGEAKVQYQKKTGESYGTAK